jgi:hypothetical protein
MAYVPDWGRLGDALRRVMDCGLSRDEAQHDICNAIADRKIRLRPRVEFIIHGSVDAWSNHRFAGEYRHYLGGLFDGTLSLEVPSRLGPAELNCRISFRNSMAVPAWLERFPRADRSKMRPDVGAALPERSR